MDPNANLQSQLELAERLRQIPGEVYLRRERYEADVMELADLVIALNEWLSGGGFLPVDWQKGLNPQTAKQDGTSPK
jgi:hypothetical protein